MKNDSSKKHWEKIYKEKDTTNEVSWYQKDPRTSIDLILSTRVDKTDSIIDIGGGDSRLVDKLLERGFKNIYVLDISGNALQKAKTRLGDKAGSVTWIESDVLELETDTRFGIWHDRAAFHFLTEKEDIARYVKIASQLIKLDGYLIVSTFSLRGPRKCSGLEITQYAEDSIKQTFGKVFDHIKSFEEVHTTPFDTEQSFLWSIFKKSPNNRYEKL